jgi:hypothetical protein
MLRGSKRSQIHQARAMQIEADERRCLNSSPKRNLANNVNPKLLRKRIEQLIHFDHGCSYTCAPLQ